MDTDQYQGMHQAIGLVGLVFLLISGVLFLALIFLSGLGLWKTFSKMGKPGWAGIIPFYNVYLIVEAIGKPVVWFVLCLIPCVNLVILIIVKIEFAERFGKGPGFGLGLAFLPFIFYPILGFGSARYLGPKPMAVG